MNPLNKPSFPLFDILILKAHLSSWTISETLLWSAYNSLDMLKSIVRYLNIWGIELLPLGIDVEDRRHISNLTSSQALAFLSTNWVAGLKSAATQILWRGLPFSLPVDPLKIFHHHYTSILLKNGRRALRGFNVVLVLVELTVTPLLPSLDSFLTCQADKYTFLSLSVDLNIVNEIK